MCFITLYLQNKMQNRKRLHSASNLTLIFIYLQMFLYVCIYHWSIEKWWLLAYCIPFFFWISSGFLKARLVRLWSFSYLQPLLWRKLFYLLLYFQIFFIWEVKSYSFSKRLIQAVITHKIPWAGVSDVQKTLCFEQFSTLNFC